MDKIENMLSAGSLRQILDGSNYKDPVMQITQIKQIASSTVDAQTRFKLHLYDGEMQHTFGILATQKNHLIESGELKANAIVRVTEYAANVLSRDPPKVVVILMNFEILDASAASEALEKKQNNENHEPMKSSPVKQQQPPPVVSATVSTNKFFKQEPVKQPPNKIKSPLNQNSSINSSMSTNDKNSFNGFKIFTISSLNPYQNKWSIKARITNKSPIRTWSNAKGEGKLFSVEFLDQTGEIKATGFTDICDKFYDLLHIDHVYYVSKAQLKAANKQYTSSDYEMTLTNETLIEECVEENDIPKINVNLLPISELTNKNANDIVDIIGVVRSCGDVTSFVAKSTNKELKKREIQLADNSNCSITITLWGKQAEDFDGTDNPVVLLKGGKISDYNGRTMSVLVSSTLQINPDIPEAHALRGWYDQGGCSSVNDLSSGGSTAGAVGGASSQTNWKSLEQVREEQLGFGEKADYFTTLATVTFAKKENSMYQACKSENCNKKVVDQNNGYFRCEKCNKEIEDFKWRMVLSINIADYTESEWVTCFQESAELILGIETSSLGDLKNQNSVAYEEVFSNCSFRQFSFKLRAKVETYNDERRVKLSVVSVEPVDYVTQGKRLLQKIKMYANSQI